MKNLIKLISIILTFYILNPQSVSSQCHIDDWFALKDVYNDANGNNWTNKTNWNIVSANSFPPANCNLGNLFGVTVSNGRVNTLKLANNNLSGSIAPEIDNLSALTELWLNNNSLSGSLQADIANLSNLTNLRLYNNSFTGSIPMQFGNLNLNQLWLFNNDLSGCYDKNLLNLCSTLSSGYNTNTYISSGNNFDASWNDFCNSIQGCCNSASCTQSLGCNPDEWFALRTLYFDTDGANWTDNTGWSIVTGGSVPSQCDFSNLFGIITNENGSVVEIELENNNLTGTIPAELDKLIELERLELDNNTLSGTIPSELGNLNDLRYLKLDNNSLSSSIPLELGNLINLSFLYLHSNNLMGEIPVELGSLLNLNYLNLAYNSLDGNIPKELGNLTSVYDIRLNNNYLSGEIPKEFENLSNLGTLIISNNQLTGNMPKEFGNLSNLTNLNLHDNLLTGSIPKEFGSLLNLRYLYLHNNLLEGNIPNELGYLTNLLDLWLFNNLLIGSIPSELGSLTNLKILYAENNQLSNNIPSTLGNLSNLEKLSLTNNCLAGNIPSEIGNLSNLESLFLDNNQLSGKLPKELGNLTNLTQFTLHHNQFTYCYEPNLSNLCNQLEASYNNNASISAVNFFDDSWQSFCNNQSGECAACNNCTVWPGDINYDGIVNNQDLAISHLFYGESGNARSTAGISWQAYNSPDWGIPQPNGNDVKHHDCDGNGNVNSNDKNAIILNYGKTHALPPGISAGIVPTFTNTDYQIYLQPISQLNNSNTLIMNVVLDRISDANIELVGGHFTVDYSQLGATVTNAAMNFEPNSWLGNLNIDLFEESWHEPANDVIHVGFTKTNGNNSIGKGVIGKVTLQLNTTNLNRANPCSTLFDVAIKRIGSFNSNTDLLPTENENLTINFGTPCCEPFININETTPFQNLYKSSSTIITDSLVIVGQNQQVQYNANRVTLNEGFRVRAGADFKVRSNGCN